MDLSPLCSTLQSSGTCPPLLASPLSAEPILAAVDAYRGTIHDFDHDVTVGAADFARGWKRLASEMAAAGLQPADRAVMAIGNGPLFPAVLAAILSRDGTPLLLHAETPLEEARRAARRYGARFIVSDAADEALEQAACRWTRLGDGWSQVAWVCVDPTEAGFHEPTLSLPGVPLHPTSGSSGQPKIAARPGHAATEEARHYVETIGIDQRDVLLAITPMSHAYAYGMCVMVPLLTGATIVTMRRFHPNLARQACQEHGVTIFPAVPAMLDMLLAVVDGPLAMPRCVLSAGAPLSERTAYRFHQRARSFVRPLYGTTETGGISVAAPAAPASGFVGPPMCGVSVAIRSSPHGLSWGNGTGGLRVNSSSMMAGYLSDDGLDLQAMTDDWFDTGDVGRLDSAGGIFLVGRESDVINVFGMKVVPSEVEEVLVALSGVVEAKVYGGHRPDGTQFVKAAIVAPGLTPPQIRAHCERQLVYYKRPLNFTLLPALPKSPTGKVLRDRLP